MGVLVSGHTYFFDVKTSPNIPVLMLKHRDAATHCGVRNKTDIQGVAFLIDLCKTQLLCESGETPIGFKRTAFGLHVVLHFLGEPCNGEHETMARFTTTSPRAQLSVSRCRCAESRSSSAFRHLRRHVPANVRNGTQNLQLRKERHARDGEVPLCNATAS